MGSSSRVGPWQMSAVAMFVLVSMATISRIESAVIQTEPTAETTREPSADVEETIHLKDLEDENEDLDEDIKYYSKDNVAVLSGANRTFNLQDYNKGLHITKEPKTGVCYVIPNNVSAGDGTDLKKYLDTGNTTFTSETKEVDAKIISNKIADTSFLPQQAKDQCSNGFRWMTVLPKPTDDGKSKRVKRYSYHMPMMYGAPIWRRICDVYHIIMVYCHWGHCHHYIHIRYVCRYVLYRPQFPHRPPQFMGGPYNSVRGVLN